MSMSITREMITAAHGVMLERGDVILSARLLECLYSAMQQAAPAAGKVTAPGVAVKAFREYLRVHPVGALLSGFEADEMALELARVALELLPGGAP